MQKLLLLTAAVAFAAGAAQANDELLKMQRNPKDWVMPTGDYANQQKCMTMAAQELRR